MGFVCDSVVARAKLSIDTDWPVFATREQEVSWAIRQVAVNVTYGCISRVGRLLDFVGGRAGRRGHIAFSFALLIAHLLRGQAGREGLVAEGDLTPPLLDLYFSGAHAAVGRAERSRESLRYLERWLLPRTEEAEALFQHIERMLLAYCRAAVVSPGTADRKLLDALATALSLLFDAPWAQPLGTASALTPIAGHPTK